MLRATCFLFLNDDTKIISPNSLEEMVSLCCQKDVGAGWCETGLFR